jgi:small GTP-binding protein
MSEPIDYNIILIGNSAVGKTSLFKKIVTGSFSEKNISTIGMDKKTFTIDAEVDDKGKKVTKNFNISLIDTAGEERFKSITKTYFKGADCILLIYDVTTRESYDNVSMWIESIHDSIGNHENSKYIIVLIGNKIDLIGVDGRIRAVEENEAIAKCQEYKINWGGECSAKTFSDVELKNLIKGYINKIYEKIGEKYSGHQVSKILAKKNKKKKGFCNFG